MISFGLQTIKTLFTVFNSKIFEPCLFSIYSLPVLHQTGYFCPTTFGMVVRAVSFTSDMCHTCVQRCRLNSFAAHTGEILCVSSVGDEILDWIGIGSRTE